MSVYKSKRGESSVQFIETARQLEAHTFACCMKAPKRYERFLTGRIVKLQELHFLKTRFYLTETGKVRRKMCRKSARRMRRKLKTFRRWMEEGRMTEEDIRTAYESWRGHMRRGNSYRVLRRMDRFYKRLMEKGA